MMNEFQEINNGDDADRAWDELRDGHRELPANPSVYEITYLNGPTGEILVITVCGFPEGRRKIEAEWSETDPEDIIMESWEGIA